jgi:hypothetical protein
LYTNFWSALFERFKDSTEFPSIITFNYDLVLERSLFQILNSREYRQFGHDGLILRYHFEPLEDYCYKIAPTEYISDPNNPLKVDPGIMTSSCLQDELKNPLVVDILKLHGSLNFPRSKKVRTSKNRPPTNVIEEPFIIPPVSTKAISDEAAGMWREALERLRGAKNVVIVGYSLPPTDYYVQYFLKTALGPSVHLRKITVFNPDLAEDLALNSPMRLRYGECFSPHVTDRLINFTPYNMRGVVANRDDMGMFSHFVRQIRDPSSQLFY